MRDGCGRCKGYNNNNNNNNNNNYHYYYHYYYYHYYHYYHCYYYCYHYRPLAPTRRGRFLSGRKWAAPSKRAGLRCGK